MPVLCEARILLKFCFRFFSFLSFRPGQPTVVSKYYAVHQFIMDATFVMRSYGVESVNYKSSFEWMGNTQVARSVRTSPYPYGGDYNHFKQDPSERRAEEQKSPARPDE